MRRELTNLRKGMKSMFVVVFIAVFGSNIIGATLFGVSLNKLVLVPLEIYLLFQNGRNLRFQVGGRQKNGPMSIHWTQKVELCSPCITERRIVS